MHWEDTPLDGFGRDPPDTAHPPDSHDVRWADAGLDAPQPPPPPPPATSTAAPAACTSYTHALQRFVRGSAQLNAALAHELQAAETAQTAQLRQRHAEELRRMHAAASAASARHTHQLEAQQRAHEEQLGDERAQWRLQREQLLAAAAEQQRQWEQQQRQWHEQRSQWEERLVEQQKQQQRQWHEQRSQWEQQLAEQQRRWDGQRRRLEEEAAAASAPPDSECVQCELLRKQLSKAKAYRAANLQLQKQNNQLRTQYDRLRKTGTPSKPSPASASSHASAHPTHVATVAQSTSQQHANHHSISNAPFLSSFLHLPATSPPTAAVQPSPSVTPSPAPTASTPSQPAPLLTPAPAGPSSSSAPNHHPLPPSPHSPVPLPTAGVTPLAPSPQQPATAAPTTSPAHAHAHGHVRAARAAATTDSLDVHGLRKRRRASPTSPPPTTTVDVVLQTELQEPPPSASPPTVHEVQRAPSPPPLPSVNQHAHVPVPTSAEPSLPSLPGIMPSISSQETVLPDGMGDSLPAGLERAAAASNSHSTPLALARSANHTTTKATAASEEAAAAAEVSSPRALPAPPGLACGSSFQPPRGICSEETALPESESMDATDAGEGQRQQSAAAAQAAAVARATAVERQKREQQAALRHARPDAVPHSGIRNRPWKSRRGLGEDPAFDVQDDYVYTRPQRHRGDKSASASTCTARAAYVKPVLAPGEFAHQQTVRKKAERQALPGHTCDCCRAFYLAACGLDHNAPLPKCEHAGAVPAGAGDTLRPERLVQVGSRHRHRYEPPPTQEEFWDLSFHTPSPTPPNRTSQSPKPSHDHRSPATSQQLKLTPPV